MFNWTKCIAFKHVIFFAVSMTGLIYLVCSLNKVLCTGFSSLGLGARPYTEPWDEASELLTWWNTSRSWIRWEQSLNGCLTLDGSTSAGWKKKKKVKTINLGWSFWKSLASKVNSERWNHTAKWHAHLCQGANELALSLPVKRNQAFQIAACLQDFWARWVMTHSPFWNTRK